MHASPDMRKVKLSLGFDKEEGCMKSRGMDQHPLFYTRETFSSFSLIVIVFYLCRYLRMISCPGYHMLTRAGNRVATYYPRCREGINSIRVLARDLVM